LIFQDAGPTITVDDPATPGTFSAGAQGNWSETPEVDGFGSLEVTLSGYTIDAPPAVTANTSLGTATDPGPYVFNGSITDDFTDDGIANTQEEKFKLTFN